MGDPQPRQHVTHPFGEQFHQRNLDRLDGAFVPAFGFQHRGRWESHLLGQQRQRRRATTTGLQYGSIAVSVNMGTSCQAAGKSGSGEGKARHSVRAVARVRSSGGQRTGRPTEVCSGCHKEMASKHPLIAAVDVSRLTFPGFCMRLERTHVRCCSFETVSTVRTPAATGTIRPAASGSAGHALHHPEFAGFVHVDSSLEELAGRKCFKHHQCDFVLCPPAILARLWQLQLRRSILRRPGCGRQWRQTGRGADRGNSLDVFRVVPT